MAEKEIATMEVNDERALFDAWAELTDAQKHGSEHDVTGWYYFDEITQDRWEAWQARAALAQRAASAPADDRFYMDHGVLHDRATGQHMWTQDQYDEQWRDMYRAGHEHAAMGYNMFAAPSPTQQAAPEAPAEIITEGPAGWRHGLNSMASAQPVAAAPAEPLAYISEDARGMLEAKRAVTVSTSISKTGPWSVPIHLAAPAAPVAQATTASASIDTKPFRSVLGAYVGAIEAQETRRKIEDHYQSIVLFVDVQIRAALAQQGASNSLEFGGIGASQDAKDKE